MGMEVVFSRGEGSDASEVEVMGLEEGGGGALDSYGRGFASVARRWGFVESGRMGMDDLKQGVLDRYGDWDCCRRSCRQLVQMCFEAIVTFMGSIVRPEVEEVYFRGFVDG